MVRRELPSSGAGTRSGRAVTGDAGADEAVTGFWGQTPADLPLGRHRREVTS